MSDRPQGLLLIISGPSGAGKTTITRHVEKALSGEFSVSMTTRPPGPKDVPGVDYHFVTHEEFKQARDQGHLLEWAEVFGNFYGTPRQPVDHALAQGRLMILEIDVQGAIQIKQQMPGALGIFILPPSEDSLLQRLKARQRDSDEVIQRRLAKAKAEIALAQGSGVYEHFIVNDDLGRAQAQAVRIVQDALHRSRSQGCSTH